MPGFQRSRIWDERELSDQIKANLLASPDKYIITSSTSNAQMEPCCLVLVDHKYPLIGLLSVSTKRSRNTDSNTATVTIRNINVRYSGPNKHKVGANVPISIYMGYSKRYIQRFEGFIDSTTMTTDGDKSTIQISCRDKAKNLIERDISCGIYSEKSEYLGVGDWHFLPGTDRFGKSIRLPRPWTRSDVIRDVCYVLGLRDIVPFISVSEVYNQATGFTTYQRNVSFGAEFDLQIAKVWDTVLTCNFVEENALDVVAKLVQSMFHEAFFDAKGRLIVRQVRSSLDAPTFYFKEERDIESITNKNDDDNVTNIITIIGQTANETAVIYPFAAVAVAESVTLEKGQDQYGWHMVYPKIVGPENIGSLVNPSLYAHTIAPGGEPVQDAHHNPENKPSYDVRTHFPNFAVPYKKQLCLDATCPIITDEAAKADTNNVRTWNFYGGLDEAVSYEKQPIILEDRFRQPVLVVCKERSMDDDLIKQCGNKPYIPEEKPDEDDEDKEPVNKPSVVDGHKFEVDGALIYSHTETPNVSTDPDPTPSYGGLPTPDVQNSYFLVGMQNLTDPPSNDAQAFLPKGMTPASMTGKAVRIAQFTAFKGKSGYKQLPDYIYDMSSLTTVADYMVMAVVTRKIVTKLFQDPVTGKQYRALDNPIDPANYDTIQVIPFDVDAIPNLLQNCVMDDGTVESKYVPRRELPYNVVDAGGDQIETISYPMVFYNASYGLVGMPNTWTFTPISKDMEDTFAAMKASAGKSMEIFNAKIDPRYVSSNNPDDNCIYWKWRGHFKKEPTKSGRGVVKQTNQGQDAEGNPRQLIHREEYYRLGADPNTVVIELMTAGIDHKSWAEVIQLDEYRMVAKGHNQYGSMKDAWDKFLEDIRKLFRIIGWVLVAISLSLFFIRFGGAAAGAKSRIATAVFLALLGALLLLYPFDDNIGANISKVMEDMTGKLTAVRRPEIELFHNSSKAGQWFILDDKQEQIGTMEHMTFGYDEGSSLYSIYQPNNQTNVKPKGMSRDYSWVFVMDLTKPGAAGGDFNPDGAWVTSIGWETPEIGDRKPIEYYEAPQGTRKEIVTRFAIEAFTDDKRDQTYSADTLLGLRFERHPTIGIKPSLNETWYHSTAYEVLVDRSMNELSITDTGFWYDFFEKRDDFVDRRYKYVALVIYSFLEKIYDNQGKLISQTEHIVQGSTPDPKVVFAHQPDGKPCRWGLFVPRGLNPQWYEKYRWFDKDPATGISKREQNYTHVKVLWAGQERLMAHLMNNFRYSTVTLDFRVWGKAYGKFAPTLVYYKERDLLSIGTYGHRELTLTNNCINDYKTARRLAHMLTAQSNETFNIVTTGKPYVMEGDVVMVKEETSGAIAGVFRNWENIWKDPDPRQCAVPGNQLKFQTLTGVYFPQHATPTYGNNTMIACSDGTKATYIVEIDKACNPIWYCIGTANIRPTFVVRWEGVGGQINPNAQTYALVGLADGSIIKIDYAIANIVDRAVLPAVPTCATMDEEQLYMFVGSASSVFCVNLATFKVEFISPGGATGIAAANWQVYDPVLETYAYREYGVLFTVSRAGIVCRQLYSDRNRTDVGPVLATFTGGLPFDNPGTLEFDKALGELVYVNKASAGKAASIHSIKVEIGLDPKYPQAGIDVEFVDIMWSIDYMQDKELIDSIPNAAARTQYINKFFQPVHAIYDVNRDLLVTDSKNNRVYRLNPSGKFYITAISDAFDFGDDATIYKNSIDMVTVAAAGSLQLTNFGKNFLNTKTQQQIDASINTGMGRIVGVLPRDKFLVKLLTSDTVVEAINNSAEHLRVRDTVVVMFGFGGDTSGVGTIIAKKSLNDWTIETGDPYVYTDATVLDVTKYGQVSTKEGNSGGSTADLTVYNSRIRTLEHRIRTLAGLHGLNW